MFDIRHVHMKKRLKRAGLIIGVGVVLAIAVIFLMRANSDNLVFFKTPSEVLAVPSRADQRLRLGGQVEHGSYRFDGNGHYFFTVTDGIAKIAVEYQGLLPDLFREGQGVVAEGQMDAGVFRAQRVLAKHDETYKPPKDVQTNAKSGQ